MRRIKSPRSSAQSEDRSQLNNLRHDPRYNELLKKMHLPV
jgi:hypothetical protein